MNTPATPGEGGGGTHDRAAPVPFTGDASATGGDAGQKGVEPTLVTFVRHGEVAAQHRATFYGGAEAELSEGGVAASLATATALAAWRPHRVVASPLRRAWILGEALAGHCGLDLHIEPGFVELDRGDWTHKHHSVIEAESPGAIAAYKADPEGSSAPGGETEAQICTRVWAAVDRLVEDAPGERVVVVAHGHVIRVIMRRLLGWGAAESLSLFMPYLARVETRLLPGGQGEVLRHPEPKLPEALQPED